MKEYKIYSLNDPDTTEIRYIGFTSQDLKSRLRGHIYESLVYKNKNSYKENWIRKIINSGKRPKINLIELVNEINWKDREIYWIEYYKNINNRLTNINKGGDAGSLDRKYSIEHRIKSSNKVYQYNSFGKLVDEYNSMVFAMEKTGISKTSIFRSIKNNVTAGNYKWKYERYDQIEPFHLPKITSSILQYDNNGNFIKEWISATEVQKTLGIKSANIAKVLRNKRPLAGGFIWKYKFTNESVIPRISYPERKVVLIDTDLEKVFNNSRELAKYLNVSYQLISKILRNEIKNSNKLRGKIIKYAK